MNNGTVSVCVTAVSAVRLLDEPRNSVCMCVTAVSAVA